MNKLIPLSALLILRGLFAIIVVCIFNPTAFAVSPDPLQHLITAKPLTAKLKSSPVFEGRGDGVALCPVTGEKITTKAYKINLHGREVYFCCKGCLQRAKYDPGRFIKPTAAEQQESVKAYVARMPNAPGGEEFCNE